jgi:hypothetical protein
MNELQELQKNVGTLAAQLMLHAADLQRWQGQILDAQYSAGDDAPLNLAARVQSAWQSNAEELNALSRSLHASCQWR